MAHEAAVFLRDQPAPLGEPAKPVLGCASRPAFFAHRGDDVPLCCARMLVEPCSECRIVRIPIGDDLLPFVVELSVVFEEPDR